MPILSFNIIKNEEEIHIIDLKCEDVLPPNPQSVATDNTLASEIKMILEQANKNYCRVVVTQVGQSNSEFTVEKKGILIWNFPADRIKQKVVPLCLR